MATDDERREAAIGRLQDEWAFEADLVGFVVVNGITEDDIAREMGTGGPDVVA